MLCEFVRSLHPHAPPSEVLFLTIRELTPPPCAAVVNLLCWWMVLLVSRCGFIGGGLEELLKWRSLSLLPLFSLSVLFNGGFGSGTGTAERRHPGAWFWTGGSGSGTGAVSSRVDSRSTLCSLLISQQKHQTLQPTDDHVTPLKLLARTF